MVTGVDVASKYRAAFANIGARLGRRDHVPAREVAAVERRLGVRVPAAIRAYFLLTGRETQINQAHNHLLPPQDWFVDAGHLVFLAENQNVVLWGVQVRTAEADPPVYQGVNGDTLTWHAEHRSSSEFMTVMVHWQAVMGAFGRTWSARVARDFAKRLAGWHHAGKVNGMHAYSRGRVALCFLRWSDGWRVFASSVDAVRLDTVGRELRIAWDP